MPSHETDEEADDQGWDFTEDMQKMEEEQAKLQELMASDEYRLACHAAVLANRLEFKEDDLRNGVSIDSEATADGDSDIEGYNRRDNSSIFDQYIISATVQPDGDFPRDTVASLRITAIPEYEVNPITFRDDVLDIVPDVEPLAFTLLSSRGTFRSKVWGRGSPNEGTAVWGSEFGRGLLVFIDHIDVKHTLRGMGIGTKLFDKALKWSKEEAIEFEHWDEFDENRIYLVVAPGAPRQDVVREFGEGNIYTGQYGERQAEVDAFRESLAMKSIAFWRKQGFRRVGLSGFWAYAVDPNHPSRQLTAEEDSMRDNIDPPA